MALITCPECNGTISDKATSCPNCGFPIASNNKINDIKESLFGVINLGLHTTWGQSSTKATTLIGSIYGFNGTIFDNREEYMKYSHMIDAPNSKLFEGISLKNAEYIKSRFQGYCNIDIRKSESTINNDHIIQSYQDRLNAPICCPRCKSQSITTGTRGYSLLTGFLGSNKTTNRCAKCGYSWQP